MPANHLNHMEGIRSVAAQYQLKNIWNIDVSGIFYRMGPRRPYLSFCEVRSEARGTELSKHKERAAAVLACSAGGIRILPAR